MCDDVDIKSLPYDFVPNTKPSKAVERLMAKRKKAHNEAIEKMRSEMKIVNEETDEVISRKSLEFQDSLKKIRENVDEAFEGLKDIQETQFSLEDHAFTNAKLEKDKAKCVIYALIEEYIQGLQNIEERRKNKMKILLQATSIQLESIAFESPFKIANFLEIEMLELNKIILNNHQNINDIEKDIKLGVEYYIKGWNEEILEIKEALKKYLKALTKLSLAKMRSTIGTVGDTSIQSGHLKEQISHIAQLQSELKLFSSLETLVPVTYEEVDTWLKSVQLTLASLDENAKNLVNNYKSIIIILFNRFFDELEELKKSILATGIIEKTELEEFQGEIYTPPVEELKIKYTEELERLQAVWGDAIDAMRNGVEETYNFLRKAASLWDRHFARVRDAQVLVECDVQNTVAKNSHSAQIFEIKVNVLLDKLRQCPEEKKLEKLLQEAKQMLDEVEKNYAAHYASEIQVAVKYHTVIETEIDILMAEIRRYLAIYPRDDERDPKKQRKRASQESTKPVDSNEQLIPINLLYCIFQIDAVKNWKFGLWEAINNYLETGRTEILTIADQWVDRQKEKIQKRYDVKLAIHRPRYARIVSSIYNRRLRELQMHNSRFLEHKRAVDIELKRLHSTVERNKEKYTEIIAEFEKLSDTFKIKISKFKKSSQIQGHLNILKSNEGHSRSLMADVVDASKQDGQALLDTILTSNLLFLKAIQFFAELGTFTVEEASDWQKNVRKIDEAVHKEIDSYYKLIDKEFHTFTTELEGKYAEVSSHAGHAIKELEFNEAAVKHITLCQNDLKNEVILSKTKLRNIETCVKRIIQESRGNVGDEFLTKLPERLKFFAEEVHGVAQFLEYRKSVKLNKPKKLRRKSIASYKASSSVTSFSPRKKSVSSVPSLEDNLISNFNWTLTASYRDIRSKAREFYAKHTQFVMSEDIIHHSYDQFLNEILHNYERLVAQCGIFWLEKCRQLLAMLDHLSKFVRNYARNYEVQFYKRGLEQSKNMFEEIMTELEIRKIEAQNDVKSMYKKLKALHGHPRNKKLLNELENESNDMAEKYKDKFANILQPYQERLKTETDDLIERYHIMKPKTDALFESVILTEITENVKTETLMKAESAPDISDSKSLTEDEVSIQKSISRQLLQDRSTESVQYTPVEENTIESFASSDSFEYSNDFLKEIQINLEVNTKKISDFVEGQLVTCIDRFNEVWANEIKNVIQLYKLRYE